MYTVKDKSNNTKRNIFIIAMLSISVWLPGLATYAVEIDAQLELGNDSNPLELSDQFSLNASAYVDLDVRLRQELTENFRVTGRVRTQSFFDESAADTTSLSARLDYKFASQLANRDATYRFDIEYNNVDRTYVSKQLGRIGETSSGLQIADRYDTDWLDYRARIDIDLTKRLRLDLNLKGRTKSYDDLSNLGLSNLDYSQWLFEPEIRFETSEHSLLTASLELGIREFDERNGRDLLTGSFVPDTELEYDYFGSKLTWRYRPDEKQQYRFEYTYEKREDNVSGYFDASDNVLRLSYRNQFTDKQHLELGVRYRDFSYDNSLDQGTLETEEAILSKDGFKLSAEYARQLAQFNNGVAWWHIGLGHEDFDSADDVYAYNKSVLSLGIHYEY